MIPSRFEAKFHPGERIAACPRWITRELVEYTMRVWSAALGREIGESEAVEMLLGVGRMTRVARKLTTDNMERSVL